MNGYASYKVADAVTSHAASGVGIYCAFRAAVVSDNAIEAPSGAGIVMHHLMTSWLNGTPGSAIKHIININGTLMANEGGARCGSAAAGVRIAIDGRVSSVDRSSAARCPSARTVCS